MDIDERIEKLTARHESLAQAVELMVHEGREYVREQRDRDAKVGALVLQLVDSVNRVARMVENHEHRITGLEGGAA